LLAEAGRRPSTSELRRADAATRPLGLLGGAPLQRPKIGNSLDLSRSHPKVTERGHLTDAGEYAHSEERIARLVALFALKPHAEAA
jgi:hypothetical protein